MRASLLPLLVALTVVRPAGAQPPPGTDPHSELAVWFNQQRDPAGRSCCGEGDGHLIDDTQWRIKDGGYQVWVNDKWWPAPLRSTHQPNPAGRAAAWWTVLATGEVYVFCIAPGDGA